MSSIASYASVPCIQDKEASSIEMKVAYMGEVNRLSADFALALMFGLCCIKFPIVLLC